MPTRRTRDRTAEAPTASGAMPIDGRHERTIRTRAAIVDAVIQLQEEGHARATAAQIAERAGTSIRSIFVHFTSQEALTVAVMDEIGKRLYRDLATRTPPGSLEQRVRTFLKSRSAILDKLVAYRRSAAAVPIDSPAARERRVAARQHLLREVAVIFAPELEGLDRRKREQLVRLIGLNCDSEAWDALRSTYGLSEAQARETMGLAIMRFLAQPITSAKTNA